MHIKLPEKLDFLITEKWRYKCSYGGRGGGKSWSYADGLLYNSVQHHERILCCREIQDTIKDSVHKLICDRIAYHNIGEGFEVTDNEIKCPSTKSSFIFKGLRTNVNEIKSMEGITKAWVEEANKCSEASWTVLIPTIREPESEIWISFNTGSEGDPAYKRFVATKRDDCKTVKINYYDNPWFPDVLRKEMEFDKKFNPLRWKNVWMGEPGGEGQFFVEFGSHLEEAPFVIEMSAAEGRLFGSLDGGTSHPTSFGLWFIDDDLKIHRLFTYQANGATHNAHAQEIYNAIESFPFTNGVFPDMIWADPAMWTKVKLNEFMVRAPIDEYMDIFSKHNKHTHFEQANNNKINGCAIMKMLFTNTNNAPTFRYWQDYNKSWVTSIMHVETDENNIEIYAKQDGDDGADEGRYGIVGCNSVKSTLLKTREINAPRTHLQKLLAGEFATKREPSLDWYNS